VSSPSAVTARKPSPTTESSAYEGLAESSKSGFPFHRLSYEIPTICATQSDSSRSYDEWTINPVVNVIMERWKRWNWKDHGTPVTVLLLLEGYPNTWLEKHLGAGSWPNSKDHAAAVGISRSSPTC
jgi:hypothetical protein